MANQGSTIVHGRSTIDAMNTIDSIDATPPSSMNINTPDSSSASSPIAVTDTSSSVVDTNALSLSENIANGNSNGNANGLTTPSPAATNTTATGKKRKRKKKKSSSILSTKPLSSSLDGLENDVLFATEQKIGLGDDQTSWKLRANARLARLRELHADIEKLRRDLTDATNRASDAEKAESLVNSGLRNAHQLLSTRDKLNVSLEMENSVLKAEAEGAKLDKKKLEGRITLLKSVADKLQIAKEECEKKLEDSITQARKMAEDLENKFKEEKRVLQQEKGELRKIHEIALQEEKINYDQEKNHAVKVTAGVAGAAGVVVGILLRGMGRRSDDHE